jgi:hypothetical protein
MHEGNGHIGSLVRLPKCAKRSVSVQTITCCPATDDRHASLRIGVGQSRLGGPGRMTAISPFWTKAGRYIDTEILKKLKETERN